MNTPTPQQLFEIQVVIARRLVQIDKLLLSTICKQHSLEKFLSEAITDLPTEMRMRIRDNVSGSDTTLEHLEAASNSFAQTVEALANLK